MLRPIVALALSVAAGLPMGCTPPRKSGDVSVSAGAAERLAIAWRFGYAGAEGPERPATARILASRAELPAAAGSAPQAGDVLLDNGEVSFVVAAADGTPRAGRVVAAWSSTGVDELGQLGVVAFDQPVVVRSVRPGTDGPTRAAWVDVLGTVETAAGPVEIATRYDAAPGVNGLLIHSSAILPGGLGEVDVALGDLLHGAGAGAVQARGPEGAAPALLARLGDRAGYALLAADAPRARTDASRAMAGLPLRTLPLVPGELVLFSRFLTVLERPDPLALRVAVARASGVAIGQVALAAVDQRGLPAAAEARWQLTLVEEGDPAAKLTLEFPRDLAPGERFVAELPVGRWDVRRTGAGLEPSFVEIRAHQLANARVRVVERSAVRPAEVAVIPTPRR